MKTRTVIALCLAGVVAALALWTAGRETLADASRLRGLACLRQGRLLSAARIFRQSLAFRSGNPRSLAPLGEAYRLLAIRDDVRAAEWRLRALDAYAAAIDAAPTDSRPWLHLGRLLADAGRHAAAEEALRTGLRCDPGDAEILEAHATALIHLDRGTDAIAELGRASRALGEASRNADWARLVRKARQAAPDLAVLRTLWEGHGFDPWPAGQYLRLQGDLEAAQAAFESAVARKPGEVERFVALADTAHQRGDLPRAEEVLRRIVLARGTPQDREKLAGVLHEAGKLHEAEGLYASLCEERQGSATAWAAWGTLLRDRGDLDSAEAVFRRGAAAHPQDRNLRRLLEDVQRRLFDRHQAEIESRYGR